MKTPYTPSLVSGKRPAHHPNPSPASARVSDRRTVAAAQQEIQRMVSASQRVTQLASIQRMANQTPAPRPQVIHRSPDFRVQRVINIHHQEYQQNAGRASKVEAQISGQTYGLNHNRPTVDPAGWDMLRQAYVMDSQQNIGMRLHLWNGRMGGPGNQQWNLTPCLTDINTAMAQEEVRAQQAVNRGETVNIKTDVSYGHSHDHNHASFYYPSHISFNWDTIDANGDVGDVKMGENGTWESDCPLPDAQDDDFQDNGSQTDETIDADDERY
ncbi:MAG: hypothetical protein SF053_09130 [Bacteroidia bacterium]|nr:hypothetical protein [Bacteroidia bacterium]